MTPQKAPQTDPLKPGFDIEAWMAEIEEMKQKDPDHPFFREMEAIKLGISCCVTPEQKAEQDRRWAEWERQKQEAKRMQTASSRRAS